MAYQIAAVPMTLNICLVYLLQAFSRGNFCKIVHYSTRFQIAMCSTPL